VSIPEKYGGLGMSFNTAMLCCDRISGYNPSFATTYFTHTGIGTFPI